MAEPSPISALVAVPDWSTRLAIESAMKAAQITVAVASNSDEAIALARAERPDVVLMDRRIPAMGAIRLCTRLRSIAALEASRIIVLGDSEDGASRQAALGAGADAYLSRLLDARTLLERAITLERDLSRSDPAGPEVLKAGIIEMIPDQWAVSVDRTPVHLTEIEYRLLQELIRVRGRVLTRETLMERVWGHARSAELETRTLDVHMSRLRSKLRSASRSIITVRNVGYRLDTFTDWLSG